MSRAPHPPLSGLVLIPLTLALALGTFMQVLDISIANVSIPAIAGDLAVSPNQGTWVITSFAVSNAIALPIPGWLARRFGEVRLFVLSTLLFSIASWLCGLAINLPMLITFRVIQGLVAGPMVPLSQSLLLNNYPAEKKGLALALWSMTVVVAPIVGPIMGGWITDNISWSWIFYINVPIGLLSSYIAWQLLGKRETETIKQPIDVVGLTLLVAGIGALQILLDKGNNLDWFDSREIIVLALVSGISLVFLVIWELTDKHPIIDLHLFARRNFTFGVLTLSIGYMVFFGILVIIPLWLQTQMGYTATWAGLVVAPIGILPVILAPAIGRNLYKIDIRLWSTFSFTVFAAVSFWYAYSINTDITYWQLAVPRFVMGLGVATFFVPLFALALSEIPPQQMASATGLVTFFRILAGSLGTSASITLWDRRDIFHHSQLAEQISTYSALTQTMLHRLANLGLSSPANIAFLNRSITQQAVILATNDLFWLSGFIFALLIILVWFARPIHGKHAS